jgi:hypothetical protein
MAARLLRCDTCGAQLYVKVNHVKKGYVCARQINPPEYQGMELVRTCPGILR